MKVALVTTTINVPHVLQLYRRYAPDVAFFVAGDRKENAGTQEFCDSIGATFLTFEDQYRRYPVLSNLVGENCIQRRNFALLEALKWGAEIVVSIDDDNIPLNADYFSDFSKLLGTSKRITAFDNRHVNIADEAKFFSGLEASSLSGWFDVGELLQPRAPHRGFPHTKRAIPQFGPVVDAGIGVAAGVCLGDPDISAVERIANGPIVHGVSEVLRSGVVTDPRQTWTVFNSQNTAFVRALAPAFFMFPGCGRFDDIYASLVMQRVMRERGYHVHFGRPFVWQQRNPHDPVKDLMGEIDGMTRVVDFAAILDHMDRFAVDKPLARQIYEKLATIDWFPKQASEAALAWCDEVEKVMGEQK